MIDADEVLRKMNGLINDYLSEKNNRVEVPISEKQVFGTEYDDVQFVKPPVNEVYETHYNIAKHVWKYTVVDGINSLGLTFDSMICTELLDMEPKEYKITTKYYLENSLDVADQLIREQVDMLRLDDVSSYCKQTRLLMANFIELFRLNMQSKFNGVVKFDNEDEDNQLKESYKKRYYETVASELRNLWSTHVFSKMTAISRSLVLTENKVDFAELANLMMGQWNTYSELIDDQEWDEIVRTIISFITASKPMYGDNIYFESYEIMLNSLKMKVSDIILKLNKEELL